MDLSRIARSGTPILLDQPRHLLFDMAATWLLIQKYGNEYFSALYREPEQQRKGAPVSLVLQSMEALAFFLWVGLQADAELKGQKLTLEDAGRFITPVTYVAVFNAVIMALTRDTFSPAEAKEAGKADAAATGPVAVAKTARPRSRLTSPKPPASRSGHSAGRNSSSGDRRSRSSTLPGRASTRNGRNSGKRKPTG